MIGSLRSLVLCCLFVATMFLDVFAAGPLKTEGSSPPSQGLKIIAVKTLKEQIYAEVFIEFPGRWTDPQITVEVNGKPVKTQRRSGGFSTDRNTAGILFAPGKPGRKTVTVKTVVDGKKTESKTPLDWRPGPFLTVLRHAGNREMIFAKEKLVLATANINDVRVLFNGNDVYARTSDGVMFLRSFMPAWKKGRNTLAVIAKGPEGNTVVKNYTFYYLGENAALAVEETAVFLYGTGGSKSGPFYELSVEGNAVMPLKEGRVYIYMIDREGWLSGEVRLTRELKARQAGVSKIRVFVKPHFLDNMELEKEMAIKVENR